MQKRWISRRCVGVMVALAVLGAVGAGAQQTPAPAASPMTPSAPHERMAIFEGTWELEPGGIPESIAKQAGRRETCAWLAGGRRHMVCRTFQAAVNGQPARESMYILSYRQDDATYVGYFAFPTGDTLVYHGKVEGDRWVMEMQPSPLLPKDRRFRTIITPTPNGLRFVEEGSKDGGPWTVGEDYRHRRVQ